LTAGLIWMLFRHRKLFRKTQDRFVHEQGDEFLGFGLFVLCRALQFEFVVRGLDQFGLPEQHDGEVAARLFDI
jgi:hypothetical protein